jgi:hypothetical protein
MLYTTIIHSARKELQLTCNEYCIADYINKYAFNANNKLGWCFASKETIATDLDLSKQTVLTIIQKLIDVGIIEKHEQTKHLKTTEKWFNVFETSTLPAVKKLGHDGQETLPDAGQETLPYKESIYNKKNIKERKQKFYDDITLYKTENPTKYPSALYNEFFTYWVELNKNQTKFRYEAEKFFDIPRRLATFWGNVPQWKKDKMFIADQTKSLNNGVNQLQQRQEERPAPTGN